MSEYASVDDYIDTQEPLVRERLSAIRALFHQVVPQTEESIRYNMPAFSVGKDHLYIGAHKSHIGLYPMYHQSELDQAVEPYRAAKTKDSLHFKHSEPLPLGLIERIIATKQLKG